MKKLLTVVIVVAIAAVFINDVGRYARARYEASVVAQNAAMAAANNGRTRTRDENAIAAANQAAAEGGLVYAYDQTTEQVHVWVQYPLEGTWVWARYLAWQSDQPLDTVPSVESEETAFYR